MTDISKDAVERMARHIEGTPLYEGCGEESDLPECAAATLRALRAELDRAETRVAKLAEVTAERDNALGMQKMAYAAGYIQAECNLPPDPREREDWLEQYRSSAAFAQGIEAAVAEIRKRWATTHAELEEYVRALSPQPEADPVREPTEAMLEAAADWSRCKYGIPIGNAAAIGCWQAMYDALAGADR